MEYINKGICIFCGRDSTSTTFNDKPHTIPRSLGGLHIGFDVCDDCNHYFGEPDDLVTPHLCVEVCVKEIFAVMRALLDNKKENSPRLKSIYFNYFKKKQRFQLTHHFRLNNLFLTTFARQFKRGLYEIFLQEYHLKTGRGLENRFNRVRQYARYNVGDLPVYHLRDRGIIFREEKMDHPSFPFSDHQFHEIDNTGFYTLILMGHWFFLEVTPDAEKNREAFLSNIYHEYVEDKYVFKDLIVLHKITDIDFTMRRFMS